MRFSGNAAACTNFRNSKRSIILPRLSVKKNFLNAAFFLHVSALSKHDGSGKTHGTWKLYVDMVISLRGRADKSLARPNSRSHRTKSIVSLERGICSCAEFQIFSCYRG